MIRQTAVVFDIQRFSIHDGPGIRTVVFLKGCALNCIWCQNPEAVAAAPELAYYVERCLADCQACLGVCPESAIGTERAHRVDFSRCTVCDRCVDVCPAAALVRVGREMTADEILDEVLKDRSFYASSGGGITLSGGEPVLQATFLRRFLPMARDAGLHVAMETAGCYPFGLLEPLLSNLDLVLFDLKIMDPGRHERLAGRDNREVHANLRELVTRGAPVQVRLPVIPGLNTDRENIADTARFLREIGVSELTLLPYNHLWEAKLSRLATDRQPLGISTPEPGLYGELQRAFSEHGVGAHL